MPTARRRHAITETDELARVLDAIEAQHPGESRARALLRLIEDGVRQREDERSDRLADRRRAIRETAGVFRGMYPVGHVEELRQEWPE